ncbi:MAG TPA: bifunctional (p)ppGpp synthetase/guanosine-3',5'-bis(diphosphate) 3'-pyrophosphohydrolase, partial [Oceanithermus sp.]|nr:bifunctional (p)ppGpp synthetase/guanosine-3',5'-bis(diphosphate) 3'-pyrophosphohydrolase [Oceanithermus sp.]
MSEVRVETLWQQLEPKVGYLRPEERDRLKAALAFAFEAHRGQKRKSGDPYITHPVAVTEILAGLGMDLETLEAGLLHDTVEDTAVTFEEIERRFGPGVRRIVEGETKVSKLPKMAEKLEDEQAENLRQMFIAMTEDVRIVIVKLADRLHNMRTLEFMPPEKQKRISQETLEIFAPLAHRLGMGQLKTELEDLAFRYLHPAEYRALKKRLEAHRAIRAEVIERARKRLEAHLRRDPILRAGIRGFEISGRTKHLYSIWRKMQREQKSLEQIYDLLALRVVLEPKDEEKLGKQVCYHTLGLVHQLWQPIPGRIKDYLAIPKPNGYQSLHTTVITEEGTPLEIQIRTLEMHRQAEYGIAAHWLYKEGITDPREVERRVSWMRAIQEWQAEFSSSRDFVEAIA